MYICVVIIRAGLITNKDFYKTLTKVSPARLKLWAIFIFIIMAKELPYFKFEPSEWLEGEIQVCSDIAIVCFINLCSGYWLKLGRINYAFALQKYCNRNTEVLQELINNKIITLIDDKICINFLDKQLNEFKNVSKKRTEAANKRWENKGKDAIALQLQSKSNAIREEKIREDKIKDNNTALPQKFYFYNSLIDYGFKKELVSDWIAVRKNKKATNTQTAFNSFIREIEKRTCNLNEILEFIVSKNWSGFKWEWYDKENNFKSKENGKSTITQTEQFKQIAKAVRSDGIRR